MILLKRSRQLATVARRAPAYQTSAMQWEPSKYNWVVSIQSQSGSSPLHPRLTGLVLTTLPKPRTLRLEFEKGHPAIKFISLLCDRTAKWSRFRARRKLTLRLPVWINKVCLLASPDTSYFRNRSTWVTDVFLKSVKPLGTHIGWLPADPLMPLILRNQEWTIRSI